VNSSVATVVEIEPSSTEGAALEAGVVSVIDDGDTVDKSSSLRPRKNARRLIQFISR